MLFDSHSHISDEMFENKEALIEQIRASSVKRVMDIGTNLQTSRGVIEMANANDFCYAVVGVHPEFADEIRGEAIEELRRMLAQPKVKAIGEIGLDYHYEDGLPREVQIECFGRQIDLAVEMGVPIAIHSRDADEDTMRVLKEHGAFSKERCAQFPLRPDGTPDARVLMHCYSSSAELARQYVKLGATISLAGPLTYKNARKAVEVAEQIPLCHLLVETDCPYLAPEPFRGQQNNPTYVEYTARKLAEIKGLSFEEVAAATYENASRFFGIE